MNSDPLPTAPLAHVASAAADGVPFNCTFTLQLPTGAQASAPGERPLGSMARIEIDGKPVTKDTLVQAPLLAEARPALLTLTF